MKYSRETSKKILIAGIVMGVIAACVNSSQKELTDLELKRPDYGEQSTAYELQADDGNQKLDISVEVKPKEYSDGEVEAHMNDVKEKLNEEIKGENDSLNQVRGKLNLVSAIDGEGIDIQWFSSDYNLVNYNGEVYNQQFLVGEEKTCVLYALLTYGTVQQNVEFPVTIVEPERTEEERQRILLERSVNENIQENLESDYAILPDTIEGKGISYYRKEEGTSPVIFPILSAMMVAVLYMGSVLEEKKKKEMRKKQLQYDYSEVVSKLTLLVGAGMTFRNAWGKIVSDYGKNKGRRPRYVYEEMENAYREMESGISEGTVYEQFGNRCDTKEYVKLASLLSQNLKKGTKGLADMLEQEARDAFVQRKNLAIQKGEEAGTKLLMPMIFMLIVVMIIVMAPAMMSFQI